MNYETYEPKRLYRSNHGIIFGVCGGIAEHFDLPAWAVRLLWIVLTMTPLFLIMILTYVILGFVIKRRPVQPPPLYGAVNDPFQGAGRFSSHTDMLNRIQERFDALDKRLQRMEDIVTHPGFGLEEKYRDLK